MADAIVNHCVHSVHISVQTIDTLLELALKMRALASIGQSAQFIESLPEIKISYLQALEEFAEMMITVMDNIDFDNHRPAA